MRLKDTELTEAHLYGKPQNLFIVGWPQGTSSRNEITLLDFVEIVFLLC